MNIVLDTKQADASLLHFSHEATLAHTDFRRRGEDKLGETAGQVTFVQVADVQMANVHCHLSGGHLLR